MQLKGRSYIESERASQIALSTDYKLVHYPPEDTYYCLKQDQTLEERLTILQNHTYKPAIAEEMAK